MSGGRPALTAGRRLLSNRKLRNATTLLLPLLPERLKRATYNALGWEVHPTARIGLSFIRVDHLEMGPGSRIGHLNQIKGLRSFTMGADSYVLNLNEILGWEADYYVDKTVVIGDRTRIMSRHFFDVSGRVTIGDDCALGGRGIHIWTHTLRWKDGARLLTIGETVLGNDVYIGARATLLFCRVADHCTVGAGAVVSGKHDTQGQLIAGNPAVGRVDRGAPQP